MGVVSARLSTPRFGSSWSLRRCRRSSRNCSTRCDDDGIESERSELADRSDPETFLVKPMDSSPPQPFGVRARQRSLGHKGLQTLPLPHFKNNTKDFLKTRFLRIRERPAPILELYRTASRRSTKNPDLLPPAGSSRKPTNENRIYTTRLCHRAASLEAA